MNASKIEYKWSSGVPRGSTAALYAFALVFVFFADARRDVPVALLLSASGILSLYMGIAYTFNSTTFLVTPKTITIVHAPVPWFGNAVVAVPDIREISCGKLLSPEAAGKPVHGYHYSFRLTDGKRVELFSSVCINKQEAADACITRILASLRQYAGIELRRGT